MSLDEWWMLGTARCIVGAGRCGAIVRTTDGGSTFAGIPSPPVSVGDVTQLRFANPRDGYAFDPELWETTNGGASWVHVRTAGQATEVAAADEGGVRSVLFVPLLKDGEVVAITRQECDAPSGDERH